MKKILLFITLLSFTFMNAQIISSVDFEDGTVGTWSFVQINTSETWGVANVTAGNGNITTKSANIVYDPALVLQNETIVSPAMDFTSVLATTNVTFSYNMSYHWGVAPNNNYDINLLVSTDGGTSWTEIWDETLDTNFTSTAGNFKWRTITVDLSSYVGQADVRLSFQYIGTDGAGAGVDEIVVSNDLPVVINAPSPVTLLTPADNMIDVYIDPTDGADADTNPDMRVNLDWDPATSGDAATEYEVYLGAAANSLNLLGTTGGDSIGVTGMTYSTTYFWSIVAKNSGGSATGSTVWSFTTAADSSASVEDEQLASSVVVYPTNVENVITIKNTSNIALLKASVYDVNGRIVMEENLENLTGLRTINVSNLSSGLYFVEMQSADGELVKKFIKK